MNEQNDAEGLIAIINIGLTANGVIVKAEGPLSLALTLGMLEEAKIKLAASIQQEIRKKRDQVIETPTPELARKLIGG